MKKIVSIFVFLTCITTAVSRRVCVQDTDCGEAKFCYNETCATCTDCALYRRSGKPTGCSRDPQECGDCLEGFTFEILGDSTVRQLCVPIGQPRPPLAMSHPSVGNSMEIDTWVPYALGAFGLMALSVFVIGLTMKRPMFIKINSILRSNVPMECETSSLYAPSAPAPPLYHSNPEIYSKISHCTYVHECAEDSKQNASKFLDPQYVTSPTNTNLHIDEPISTDVVDSVNNEQNGEPYLFDENTLPSTWSPGPDYADPQISSLPTSFVGVLRLNDSSSSVVTSVNHADTNSNSGPTSSNLTAVTESSSTGMLNV